MHDPEIIFKELGLKKGDVFLDLGCGPGDYSIHATSIVGPTGFVYSLDKWEEMINNLKHDAASQGLENIEAMSADITEALAIKDNSIDVCLISTVLHIPGVTDHLEDICSEIIRVLVPHGRLAVIECKKEDTPTGPPLHLRLSPNVVEAEFSQYGFKKIGLLDLGYNYMIQFQAI